VGWAYTRPVRSYFQRHENARTAGAIGAGAADYYISGGTPVFSSAYAFYIADITGGDPWEAAAVAAITSYASAGVGTSGWAWYTKVFWYGVIGGTVSKHYGGEFEQGFKASAAASAVGMGLNSMKVYPAISASVAGGVSAELGGGKFKNGAARGAFAYAVSGMFAEAQNRPDRFEFDKSTGELTLVKDGATESLGNALSGPHGNGALEAGEYTLDPSFDVPSDHMNGGFCDPAGNCWFSRLHPQFETQRSGLGMHPDGNIEGTAGCVGLCTYDTTPIRNTLDQNTDLNVRVVE